MAENTYSLSEAANDMAHIITGLREFGEKTQQFSQAIHQKTQSYQTGIQKIGQAVRQFHNFSDNVNSFLRSVGERGLNVRDTNYTFSLDDLSPKLPPTYNPLGEKMITLLNNTELAPARLSEEDVNRIAKAVAMHKTASKKHHHKLSGDRLVDYVIDGDNGFLKINKHKVMKFTGQRRFTIGLFANSENRKEWKDYENRELVTFMNEYNLTAAKLRSEIGRINKRVYRETNGNIAEIIQVKQVGDSSNSPMQYRWAL